jgi:hypothetical protein
MVPALGTERRTQKVDMASLVLMTLAVFSSSEPKEQMEPPIIEKS